MNEINVSIPFNVSDVYISEFIFVSGSYGKRKQQNVMQMFASTASDLTTPPPPSTPTTTTPPPRAQINYQDPQTTVVAFIRRCLHRASGWQEMAFELNMVLLLKHIFFVVFKHFFYEHCTVAHPTF